jgi:hypothetical protein
MAKRRTEKPAKDAGGGETPMARFKAVARKLVNVPRNELAGAQKRYVEERQKKKRARVSRPDSS